MSQWLDKIPLPYWATLLIVVLLLAVIVLLFRHRRLRFKTIGLGTSGPYVEFEKNPPDESATYGIDQEVKAEKGGSIKQVEQAADGKNIRQKVHAKNKGTIEGVKQNAKTR